MRVFSGELSDGWRDFLAIPVVKLRSIDSVRNVRYEISLSMRKNKDYRKSDVEREAVCICIYVHMYTRTYLHLKSVLAFVYVHD